MDSSVPRASGAESDNRDKFPSAVEWARAIDLAAEGGATEKYVPPKPVLPPKGPNTAGDSLIAGGLASLGAIAAALEKAATPQDQLELSCGLPLVRNLETGRYTLAPTAATVLRFTIENANRPPPKLSLGSSALFAKRTAAALEAPPVAPSLPPVEPMFAGGDDATVCSLNAIAAALEKAATPQDQLEVSCGLPLVTNPATGRYSLAPTAAAVLRFTRENANRPLPKLNLGSSALFAKRTAAALEARTTGVI
jgi:hypothetical protein